MIDVNKIYNIDCLEGLKEIDDKSVDLIFTDPPYNIKYKNEKWDSRDDYLEFMEKVFLECERVLKNSGFFYFFHNQFNTMSKLNSIIETKTNFTLNSFITWHKKKLFIQNWGYPSKYKKVCLNKFFQTCEYIFFYTFKGRKTKGELIHNDKNNFRSIKDYLIKERDKSNLKAKDLKELLKSYTYRHYFSDSQFSLISEKDYKILQQHTGNFKKDYKEIKEEYEKLKEEYYKRDCYNEFEITFNKFDLEMENFIETNLNTYGRVHPCQKPREVVERFIRISSNKNDLVLDLFSGSGIISKVSKELGRNFIGFELDQEYYKKSLEFLEK